MTSNTDSRNSSRHLPQPDSSEPRLRDTANRGISPPCDVMNNLKRDRFELLSAYLDGEVTAAERRQVETWLEADPQVQCLHARLLKLRQGMQSLPIPASKQPTEQTAACVFRRIDRRRQLVVMGGGMAIAAVVVGFFSQLIAPPLNPSHQLALDTPSPNVDVSSDALMIALDQPIIEIPKAPVSGTLRPLASPIYDPSVQTYP